MEEDSIHLPAHLRECFTFEVMEVGKGKRAQNADSGGSLGEALALRWCSWDLASCPGIFDLLPIMALKSLTFLTLISQYFHSYLMKT